MDLESSLHLLRNHRQGGCSLRTLLVAKFLEGGEHSAELASYLRKDSLQVTMKSDESEEDEPTVDTR